MTCRRRQPTEVRFHLRLYPGQDDELIRWLEQFDDQPYGTKTQAVKDALLRGAGNAPDQAAARALDPSVACDELRRVELSGQSLAEVRRVVEAAVETALARLGGQVAASTTLKGTGVAPSEEDDEAEDLLDALGESLVLKDLS